jgi:uncharacterized protein YceH (UPF0502 family)
VEPDAAEIRVLGCLIEKQRTTPDGYPLTLNSLRLACNQSTNRDPVVDYDEGTIRDALERLGKRGWTRLATWSNRRTVKYRHLFDEALGLSDAETALLCVLMLRGPQTPGELKARGDRLHAFADTGEVERVLEGLSERGLVRQLARRAGERGRRYAQLVGGAGEEAPQDAPARAPEPEALPAAPGLEDRVARLEAQLDELRELVEELRRGPARDAPAGP